MLNSKIEKEQVRKMVGAMVTEHLYSLTEKEMDKFTGKRVTLPPTSNPTP